MEKIAHSPFLYHLFICCGGDYKTFVNEISNQIETKIEEIYASVKHEIAKRKPEQPGFSDLRDEVPINA